MVEPSWSIALSLVKRILDLLPDIEALNAMVLLLSSSLVARLAKPENVSTPARMQSLQAQIMHKGTTMCYS